MRTEPVPNSGDPQTLENDRAFDEAHIRMRAAGRQLVIDTGQEPDADELDIHPEHEDEAVDRAEANAPDPPTPKGDEQVIPGFSDCARRRLRNRLHAMRRDADGLFLTLTYHETDPTPDECKRHLDRFWKRLERRFPGISAIWKMEPQERGIPHFHLVIYGVQFVPLPLLLSMWHEVTDETSDEHRQPGSGGVEVERFVNENGKLQSYMAKYMAETYDTWPKAEEGDPWAETGRWWGCLGRKHLPFADWDEAKIYLDQHEAEAMIGDLLDRWDLDMPDGVIPPSLTICTRGHPEDWIDRHLSL